jgi:uncharacterized integral membrane protein
MSTKYIAEVNINCRKEHTCAGCGALYSYPLVRKIRVESTTSQQAAQEQANANAATTTQKEIELHPCPTCGLYQPDMVAKQRKAWHLTILIVGSIVAMIILLVANAGFAEALSFTALQANTATIVMVFITAAEFIGYMLVEFTNPNADPSANARLSAAAVAGGAIRHVPGRISQPPADLIHPPKSTAHRLALPMVLLGVALIGSSAVIRSMNHWPLNPDCVPSVVGAGDNVRIYMKESVVSFNADWRGEPKVTFTTEKNSSPINANASAPGRGGTWEGGGTQLTVRGASSEAIVACVDILVPQSLTGGTANCRIDLDVTYPAEGSSGYHIERTLLQHSFTVNLAPLGAGSLYTTLWWGTTLSGLLLTVIGGILLVRAAASFSSRALPVRVLTS